MAAQPKSPASPGDTDRSVVVVGRVQGPYGIKGWVRVAAFTDPPENILDYRPWLVRCSGAGESDWQRVRIAESRPHKQGFVVRFDDVEDRAAAERLQGATIGVPEEVLPAPAADEYYWRDLIGAVVCDLQGEALGTISALLETGANDVLVVENEAHGGQRLIPFHRRYVLDVDLAARRVRVDWQED